MGGSTVNEFSDELAGILKDCANYGVKQKIAGLAKPYWSHELTELKRLSIEAHAGWVAQGRPRFGVVNDNRLLCKARYKQAFRLARRNFENNVSDRLALKLLHGNSKSFWAEWKAKFGSTKVSNVEVGGNVSPDMVAQGFADYFKGNYCDSAVNIKLKERYMAAYESLIADPVNLAYAPFTVSELKLAIAKLKKGKSPGMDKVTPEMVLFAGGLLPIALTNLFNMCLLHGVVPSSFSMSVIVPIVKDTNGGYGEYDNYRPISLVNLFSKLLELCMSERLNHLFKVDELQYGFVAGKGCQKALFSLESIVNYYTSRGSPVYMAALDATKAFDRVNHYALFHKLLCLGVSLCFLNVIVYWHLNLCGCVLWHGALSAVFNIRSGVRQGGVNSPWYFSVYINDLIDKLRCSGYGCHLCSLFVGCLLFADDILLLSGSILQLQLMLDICVSYVLNLILFLIEPNLSYCKLVWMLMLCYHIYA